LNGAWRKGWKLENGQIRHSTGTAASKANPSKTQQNEKWQWMTHQNQKKVLKLMFSHPFPTILYSLHSFQDSTCDHVNKISVKQNTNNFIYFY